MSDFVYAKFVDGQVQELKPVGKGRPPRDAIRAEKKGDKLLPIFKASTGVDFETLKSKLRAGQQSKNNDQVVFLMCDVSPELDLPFLNTYSKVSHIDLDMSTNTLKVWVNEYDESQPDAIITDVLALDAPDENV